MASRVDQKRGLRRFHITITRQSGVNGLPLLLSARHTGRISCSSSFFFQAEDGIRDYKVTGVQTCALPISCDVPHMNMTPRPKIASSVLELIGHTPMVRLNRLPKPGGASVVAKLESVNPGGRSEERRVGKECRSRWSPYH